MYSLGQILRQEPNAIRTALLAILGALVITGVVELDAEEVAAWGIAAETVLTLLYVRPLSVSKDSLNELDQP